MRGSRVGGQVVEHKAVGTDVTWKIPDSGLFEK